MAKAVFRRGLSAKTLPYVKSFLGSKIGEFIKDDPRFVLCIRDEYVNMYYCGCSVLKYEPIRDKFSVHSKYVGETKSESYVTLQKRGNLDLICGDFNLSDVVKKPELHLGRYICGEKKHLAGYLDHKNPFLLDLEIAFTRKRNVTDKESKRQYVANRIDLGVISDDLELCLVEVKVDTDRRLRSENDGDQEILTQLGYYRDFINNESIQIISSYKTIAQNFIDLGLTHKLSKHIDAPAKTLARFIEIGKLSLDPSLLVVETGKKKVGKYGINHWQRLLEQLSQLGYLPPNTWSPPS